MILHQRGLENDCLGLIREALCGRREVVYCVGKGRQQDSPDEASQTPRELVTVEVVKVAKVSRESEAGRVWTYTKRCCHNDLDDLGQ